MRLIDADELKKSAPTNLGVPMWQIDNAFTIDAVPVVRCKDCIYQAECAFIEWLGRNGNGFCSCGERRKDETG